MNKKAKTIGLIASLFVAFILVLFFVKHELLFEIKLNFDIQQGIRLLNKNWVVKPDVDGIVHFNLTGVLENKDVPKVMMEITPVEEHTFYLQGDGYKVIDAVFLGKAQLGSPDFPMKKDQQYAFRLTEANDKLLAQGKIDAYAHKVYGTDSLILIFITFLASVIQILSFLAPLEKKS